MIILHLILALLAGYFSMGLVGFFILGFKPGMVATFPFVMMLNFLYDKNAKRKPVVWLVVLGFFAVTIITFLLLRF